jgi:hypothetical protein
MNDLTPQLTLGARKVLAVRIVVTDPVHVAHWGVFVTTADQQVTFAINGPGSIAAVGNGDVTSDEPYAASSRRRYQGRALVVVRGSRKAGAIRLTATGPGLAAATTTALR